MGTSMTAKIAAEMRVEEQGYLVQISDLIRQIRKRETEIYIAFARSSLSRKTKESLRYERKYLKYLRKGLYKLL